MKNWLYAMFFFVMIFCQSFPSYAEGEETNGKTGWVTENGDRYRYENGVKLGTEESMEFFDPDTNGWYYLDASQGGKALRSMDFFLKSFAGEYAEYGNGTGKWVRYDENGRMITGWDMKKENWYYFDPYTGSMLKGVHIVDGYLCYFDKITGWLQLAGVNLSFVKWLLGIFLLSVFGCLTVYLLRRHVFPHVERWARLAAGMAFAAALFAGGVLCLQVWEGKVIPSISEYLDTFPSQYTFGEGMENSAAAGGSAETAGWRSFNGSWYYFDAPAGRPIKGMHWIDRRLCWFNDISGRLERVSLELGQMLKIAVVMGVGIMACILSGMYLRKKKLEQYLIYPAMAAMLVLHVFVGGVLGFQREYLFTDEVFSYGLANCEKYAFIDTEHDTSFDYHWVDGSFFEDYLKYDSSVPFSFQAAYHNQVKDVHPPVYYMLLHAVNFFFQDLVYSPIPGIVLNLLIMVLIDLLIFYIAKYFLRSKALALLAAALWGFSASGLSNVLYIRMYLLAALQILLYVAFHIYMAEHPKGKTWQKLSGLLALVIFGGLTHYYNYFFIAVFSGIICLVLLFDRHIKEMFIYGGTLLLGLGINLLLFPATLHHIFDYRGTQTLANFTNGSFTKLFRYGGWVDNALFGGFGIVLLVAVFIFCLFKMAGRAAVIFQERRQGGTPEDRERTLQDSGRHGKASGNEKSGRRILAAVVLADVSYAFLAISGAEIVSMRYVYPCFPLLAIVTVLVLSKLSGGMARKRKAGLIAVCCAVMVSGSLYRYGVDWLYADWDLFGVGEQLESMKGKDCVFICRHDAFNDVYAVIHAFQNMDEVIAVFEEDISQIPGYLAQRESEDGVLISFPSVATFHTDAEIREILDEIIAGAGCSKYELVYNYDNLIYYLIP